MRLPRVLNRPLLLGATHSLVLAVGASQALAVIVDAAPTWPIPPDTLAARPPIPDLPPAPDAPPPSNPILTVWRVGTESGEVTSSPATSARAGMTYDDKEVEG